MRQITSADVINLPKALVVFMADRKQPFDVFFWIDETRALYLRNGIGAYTGRLTGKPCGLDVVIGGSSILEALQHVKTCEIISKDFNWSGSLESLIQLVKL